MSKRVKYTDEPMEFAVVADFLPSPEELVRRKRRVRVTLEVGEPTVELFRKKARKSATGYQKLMGELLDVYATRQAADRH